MPAIVEYGTARVGRVVLREALTVAAQTGGPERGLALTGQESVPPQTPLELTQLQDDLLGLPDHLVPVRFTHKADRDGYYRVTGSSADLMNWTGEVIKCDWKLDLTWVGSDTELDLESRMGGAQTRDNDYGVVAATRWHSPPVGHYSYWAAGSVPSILTRTGIEGAQIVYLGLPIGTNPRWGCAVPDYGRGRVRLLDGSGTERSGLSQTLAPTGWALHNGLCRITPAGTSGVSGSVGVTGAPGVGTLNVATWTGSAWSGKDWVLELGGTGLPAPLAATLLRNDYEAVTLRLIWAANPGPGRVYLDLLLRRGSRLAELWVQSSIAGTVRLARATADPGTQTAGFLVGDTTDPDGNRYFAAGAATFTATPADGALSRTTSTGLDFTVGAVVGGAGALVGDRGVDLYNQYLGAPSEQVQGVRR